MHREATLTIHFTTFGKPEHVQKSALYMKRHLESVGYQLVQVTLDGNEITDDYSDDQGEHWHHHDWKTEPVEDEGRHPFPTAKMDPRNLPGGYL